jgi:hypothetical protein
MRVPDYLTMTVGFSTATVCLVRMLGAEKLRGLALVETCLVTGMGKGIGFTPVGARLVLTWRHLCS